ncbi:MAG: Smr/MutS family protein [Acidobacteria bacterium]|nr:Smr/MutS family protein [Acidobacteriota bacterium]
MFALRSLEFDRIIDVVVSLALTPFGEARLALLVPERDATAVAAALSATSEARTYLETHALFPLRAGAGLDAALAALAIEGRFLEPLQLRIVADFLDSVGATRAAVMGAGTGFPLLQRAVAPLASFTHELAGVRRAIDVSGEVLDEASPALRSIRDGLRQMRQRLRATLEQFVRGRDTAKYLQEQVITERNGRYVLLVRAEHRSSVPGIVHGSSASGASLFLEPAPTVEVNNDIVELEEAEREEIVRILTVLTDAFRVRAADLRVAVDIATELDAWQAKARFGSLVNGTTPKLTTDASFALRGARHPLLIESLRTRQGRTTQVEKRDRVSFPEDDKETKPGLSTPVPIDIILDPPHRVLLITGPNTGGKTVALKTAGLFALMAQAGLHLPADDARLPVFRTIVADIGDEQSISADLSTFSAHITNIVAMDRSLEAPSLILLDEVGTGTDPNEGGALATAIVSHFQQRGALVMATTHYDALKTWGAGTEGVAMAAFAFDPVTFAPTYRLVYGAPGRSLAIEIARRLGMPMSLIAAARGFLSEDQKRLAAHLARVDSQARALESERSRLQRDKRSADETARSLAKREQTLAEREARFTKRLDERLDDRLRQARRDIDEVIDELKARADGLVEQASLRSSGITTGQAGAARTEARAAVDRIVEQLRQPGPTGAASVGPDASSAPDAPMTIGAKVAVGALGLEGTLLAIHGRQAEVDVRGKRLRAALENLRLIAAPAKEGRAQPSRVQVSVDLQPREGLANELNVVGCSVADALDQVARFLDDTLVTDTREVRIVHGHGTGQLRRGIQTFLKEHALVQKFYAAPESQGGGGATIAELRE